MKSYTDIEQSKKLAEILPLGSADMAWCNNSIRGVNYTDEYSANLYTVKEMQECFDETLRGWDKYWKLIPCWSLTALLEQLDDNIADDDGNDWQLEINKEDGQYYLNYHDRWGDEDDIETDYYDDLIDACYEMILKLNEQKIL